MRRCSSSWADCVPVWAIADAARLRSCSKRSVYTHHWRGLRESHRTISASPKRRPTTAYRSATEYNTQSGEFLAPRLFFCPYVWRRLTGGTTKRPSFISPCRPETAAGISCLWHGYKRKSGAAVWLRFNIAFFRILNQTPRTAPLRASAGPV